MRMRITILATALIVLLSAAAPPVSADTARERLQESYRLLVEADVLLRTGNTSEVVRIYRDAVAGLETFQRQYPGWNQEVIAARLAHARNRLERLERGEGGVFAEVSGDVDKTSLDSSGIDRELAWREKLAQAQADIRGLLRENAELKGRIKALERLPGDDQRNAIERSERQRISRLIVDEAERLSVANAESEALALLEAAGKLFTDDPVIALGLGLAYCRAGNFEPAARILRRVAAGQPDNVTARLALGAAWLGLGNLGSARAEIEAVLAMDPGNQDAHYNMARLLLLLPDGDPALARRYYMQSVALGGAPDPEIEDLIQRAALRQIGRGR